MSERDLEKQLFACSEELRSSLDTLAAERRERAVQAGVFEFSRLHSGESRISELFTLVRIPVAVAATAVLLFALVPRGGSRLVPSSQYVAVEELDSAEEADDELLGFAEFHEELQIATAQAFNENLSLQESDFEFPEYTSLSFTASDIDELEDDIDENEYDDYYETI